MCVYIFCCSYCPSCHPTMNVICNACWNLYDHAHRSPKKTSNNLIKWKNTQKLTDHQRIQMIIILLSTRSFAGLCIRLSEMIFDFYVTFSPEQQRIHPTTTKTKHKRRQQNQIYTLISSKLLVSIAHVYNAIHSVNRNTFNNNFSSMVSLWFVCVHVDMCLLFRIYFCDFFYSVAVEYTLTTVTSTTQKWNERIKNGHKTSTNKTSGLTVTLVCVFFSFNFHRYFLSLWFIHRKWIDWCFDFSPNKPELNQKEIKNPSSSSSVLLSDL